MSFGGHKRCMWGGMIAVESRRGWEDFYRDVGRFEAKAASRAVRCAERNSTMLHRVPHPRSPSL